MIRSYLIAHAIAKRHVVAQQRERSHKEVLESRLVEAEQEFKRGQASLLCQIETLQEELKIAGGKSGNLSREVEDLRANLEAAQKLAEEMEQQVQHVQTLHEAKTQQLEKDTQEQTVRSAEAADMRKRYEALKERVLETEARAQETVDLRKRYDALKENYDFLRQSHEKMKERLTENDTRSQETTELRKRNEVLKESSESLRQSNEQLKEKLIENENFLRTQEGKVSARFEKQLAESRCECAQANADRDDLEANLETCKRQLQTAREQNAKLRAYFEESDDVDKENHNTGGNVKPGFISNALGQARRTLQLGHFK